MIRRPPRSTLSSSSAASDVYKRQPPDHPTLYGSPCFKGAHKNGMPTANRTPQFRVAGHGVNTLFPGGIPNAEYPGYQLKWCSFQEAGIRREWWTPGSSVASTPRRLSQLRQDAPGIGQGRLSAMVAERRGYR
eukprot:TRINITY_DN62772_c0_g2_i1.p1 TRINITY_DN62772_c0_g2~~TRINITY_DN62772_c0_g2_i1.p1  ORF type:complete len:133 (+),score=6.80 TRINITY_DN62772_c0_g2_i1:98-496(+)